MIKVKRIDCPDILDTSNSLQKSKGMLETEEAINFYSSEGNKEQTFKTLKSDGTYSKKGYKIYSDSEVREKLIKMFHGKCAYCESSIIAVCPGDIEHFRPKGRYEYTNSEGKQAKHKPGYYWLAADWENLLLACPFCNQTNTHKVFKNGQWVKEVQGKLDQFPLFDEDSRLTIEVGQLFFSNKNSYISSFQGEEDVRLLLNPCVDDVTSHFQYQDDGLIQPKENLNRLELARAENSIRVYALQRVGLVQQRSQKIIEIKAQIQRIREYICALDKVGNILFTNRIEDILKKEMKILRDFMEPGKPYAGMARYFINLYFQNLI